MAGLRQPRVDLFDLWARVGGPCSPRVSNLPWRTTCKKDDFPLTCQYIQAAGAAWDLNQATIRSASYAVVPPQTMLRGRNHFAALLTQPGNRPMRRYQKQVTGRKSRMHWPIYRGCETFDSKTEAVLLFRDQWSIRCFHLPKGCTRESRIPDANRCYMLRSNGLQQRSRLLAAPPV